MHMLSTFSTLYVIRTFFIISSVVLFFSNLTSVCIASETTNESRPDSETKHEIQYNHIAVFVGGMSPVDNSNETFLALGLSYERRLNEPLSIEVLADFTVGSQWACRTILGRCDLSTLYGIWFKTDDWTGI